MTPKIKKYLRITAGALAVIIGVSLLSLGADLLTFAVKNRGLKGSGYWPYALLPGLAFAIGGIGTLLSNELFLRSLFSLNGLLVLGILVDFRKAPGELFNPENGPVGITFATLIAIEVLLLPLILERKSSIVHDP